MDPILDLYPDATTSPIYVTVGKEPVRSRPDAEYFIAWIARLEAAALAHRDWNTEEETANTLETLRRAKEEFVRRRHP